MKKLFFLCCCFLIFSGCYDVKSTKSKISWLHFKARKLIKEHAKHQCHFPATYKSIAFTALYSSFNEVEDVYPINTKIDSLICEYFPNLCIENRVSMDSIDQYNSRNPDIKIESDYRKTILILNVIYPELKIEDKNMWDSYKKLMSDFEKKNSEFIPKQLGWTCYHTFQEGVRGERKIHEYLYKINMDANDIVGYADRAWLINPYSY